MILLDCKKKCAKIRRILSVADRGDMKIADIIPIPVDYDVSDMVFLYQAGLADSFYDAKKDNDFEPLILFIDPDNGNLLPSLAKDKFPNEFR